MKAKSTKKPKNVIGKPGVKLGKMAKPFPKKKKK